jgi:hypothetical protein
MSGTMLANVFIFDDIRYALLFNHNIADRIRELQLNSEENVINFMREHQLILEENFINNADEKA